MKSSLAFFFTLTLTFFTSLTLLVPPVHAAESPAQGQAAIAGKGQNLTKFTYESFESFGNAGGAAFMGVYDRDGNLQSEGAIHVANRYLTSLLTDPPAKTGEYIADVMRNFGIIQPAYAQGIGFSALTPVLTLWKTFRNLAYFIFILIFIIVGFMIMFRAQLNPQTVVTVQAALPKMVVTLILITFSYAIAGFVIDLIYLILFVVTSLFQTFGILESGTGAAKARNALFGQNIIDVGFNYLFSPAGATGGSASNAIAKILDDALNVPWWARGLVHAITSSIFYLIIVVAMLIALFRTLFMLITSWINILLSIIFAPLQLLLNALPNMNTFGGWLRNLVANAMVFPAVGIMIIIGIALSGNDKPQMGVPPINYQGGGGWVPPLITNYQGREGGTPQIQSIIGLGIILLLPEIAKLVKGALGAEDKLGLGQMAMANFARGTAPMKPFKTFGALAGTAAAQDAGRAGLSRFVRWREQRKANRDIGMTPQEQREVSDRADAVSRGQPLPTPSVQKPPSVKKQKWG